MRDGGLSLGLIGAVVGIWMLFQQSDLIETADISLLDETADEVVDEAIASGEDSQGEQWIEPAIDLTDLPLSMAPAEDCLQDDDLKLKISGCSAILADASQPVVAISQAHFSRGLAYVWGRHYDLGRADYDKAIELTPNYPVVYENRGILSQFEKDYAAAAEDFESAVLWLEQRYEADPSEPLADYLADIKQRAVTARAEELMEERWLDYLEEIQLAGAHENWQAPPLDLYVGRNSGE